MRQATMQAKSTRQHATSARQERPLGADGVSLTPPPYGVNFVDRSAAGQDRARSADSGGLPAGLRAGIEALSGFDMSDVRVHRGSPRPAEVQAHAFTQGSEIHLGPGQERYLPHEAWHVVQQKEGRVKATLQVNGVEINAEPQLEREADGMGARAAGIGQRANLVQPSTITARTPQQQGNPPLQGGWLSDFVSGLTSSGRTVSSRTALQAPVVAPRVTSPVLLQQQKRQQTWRDVNMLIRNLLLSRRFDTRSRTFDIFYATDVLNARQGPLSQHRGYHGDSVPVDEALREGHGPRETVEEPLLDWLDDDHLRLHQEDSVKYKSALKGTSGYYTAGNFAGEHGAVSEVDVLAGPELPYVGEFGNEFERPVPSRIYPSQIIRTMPTTFSGKYGSVGDLSNSITNPSYVPLVVPDWTAIQDEGEALIEVLQLLQEGTPEADAHAIVKFQRLMRRLGRDGDFSGSVPEYSLRGEVLRE